MNDCNRAPDAGTAVGYFLVHFLYLVSKVDVSLVENTCICWDYFIYSYFFLGYPPLHQQLYVLIIITIIVVVVVVVISNIVI